MRAAAFLLLASTMSVAALSQTSVPAAPTLTAGAQFKGLRFDWNRVPGATWYQLEFRAHQTGSFVQQGDDFPATATSTRFSFPLHLFDWTYARYRLAACNSTGCSRSAEVSVSALRRDAVGYFKAAQSQKEARFGRATDLSPDGYNLVATAPGEVTVSGNNLDGGAAYVFQRGSNGLWSQRARLQLLDHEQMTEPEPPLTLSIATSGTGNTVAVGMPSNQRQPFDGHYGDVDVFRFQNGVWTRTRVPHVATYGFGNTVALSENGYVLAVGTNDTDSSLQIFRNQNGVWNHVRTFGTRNSGYIEMCGNARLSRDGSTVAEQCREFASDTRPDRLYVRVFSGTNWSVRTDIDISFPVSNETIFGGSGFAMDRSGDTIATQYSQSYDVANAFGSVKVFKRNGAAYSQVVQLTPGAWRADAGRWLFGTSIALSGDGQTLAVGDPSDNGRGWGPRAAPLIAGADTTGAAYVYRMTDQWRLANMVKPNYGPYPAPSYFGRSVQLSQTGKTLVVAGDLESSSASGIDGDWANSDRPYSGAIFMY